MIDLHIHTCFSDGTDAPLEILQKAEKLGLKQIAITDHNCIDGALQAVRRLYDFSFDFLIGCELSCLYKGKEVHLLGYFSPQNAEYKSVRKFIEKSEQMKTVSHLKIIKLLNEAGINISYKELKEKFPDTVLNRVHISRLLMEKGYVSTVKDGFDMYVGEKAPCYVAKDCPSLKEGIEAIKNSGGISVLAHPFQYVESNMETYLQEAMKTGIDGIEALHARHNKNQRQELVLIAQKNNKIITGGSDYHGTAKPETSLGCANVPDKYMIRLHEYEQYQKTYNIKRKS